MELTTARCVLAFASLWIALGLFGLMARSGANHRRQSTLVLLWGLLTTTAVSSGVRREESILPLVVAGVIAAGLLSTRRTLVRNSNGAAPAGSRRSVSREPESPNDAIATANASFAPNSVHSAPSMPGERPASDRMESE